MGMATRPTMTTWGETTKKEDMAMTTKKKDMAMTMEVTGKRLRRLQRLAAKLIQWEAALVASAKLMRTNTTMTMTMEVTGKRLQHHRPLAGNRGLWAVKMIPRLTN